MSDTGAMIHIQSLIDETKGFETVRALRWPAGVRCPTCAHSEMTKQGHDDTQPERQRYLCKSCGRRFDDLTDTILAGHHQPLRVWMLCLYLMGLNLSNAPIAQELDLNKDDVLWFNENRHLDKGDTIGKGGVPPWQRNDATMAMNSSERRSGW
jgi:transposase-like protein